MEIVELSAAQTHDLRRVVLRDNDPTRSVVFAGDEDPLALHLGAIDRGEIIAVSTWIPRSCPDLSANRPVQLRGMATASSVRGSGVGGQLFEFGVERWAELGYDLVWARARDSALGFYTRHGCRVVGAGFVDEVTQLDHHIVVLQIVDRPGVARHPDLRHGNVRHSDR